MPCVTAPPFPRFSSSVITRMLPCGMCVECGAFASPLFDQGPGFDTGCWLSWCSLANSKALSTVPSLLPSLTIRISQPLSFPPACAEPYSFSKYSTASSSMPSSRSSSLYAGTTTLMKSSGSSIGICGGTTTLAPGCFAACFFAASFSAAHRSSQQGKALGSLREPSGNMVVYCFSDRRGSRGDGANRFIAI
jgi:hypothetical protein